MASSNRQIFIYFGTDYLMKGIQCYKEKKYTQAANYFMTAARVTNNAEAINYLYILGQYYLLNNNYVQALELLSIAAFHHHEKAATTPFDLIFTAAYYKAHEYYNNKQYDQAEIYFIFLLEHQNCLSDYQHNQVLHHLGLLSCHFKNIRNAWEYFFKASMRGHEPSFDIAIHIFSICYNLNMTPFRDELWRQIQAKLRKSISNKPFKNGSETASKWPTVINKENPENIKQAESLQKDYDIKILSSCISAKNKNGSQNKIAKKFQETTCIHYQDNLFSLLENDTLSILNQHANPWIDWFFGIKYTASYCKMLQKIRSNAKNQLFKEFYSLRSLEMQKNLLVTARNMQIFSASISNYTFNFFQQDDALNEIDEKLAAIEKKEIAHKERYLSRYHPNNKRPPSTTRL